MVLAANTSDSVRVDWNGAAGSFLTFNGGGTAAGSLSALNRMEGATLNLVVWDNGAGFDIGEVRRRSVGERRYARGTPCMNGLVVLRRKNCGFRVHPTIVTVARPAALVVAVSDGT